MADDPTQRPYRSTEAPPRSAPGAAPASGSDPLAELARLIGQNDPFAEFGRDNARRAIQQPAAEWSVPPAAPDALVAAPGYGPNDYHSAPTRAVPAYGAPVARQPYANSTYAADAGLYQAENQAPGYPAAPTGSYKGGPYQQNQMHQTAEDEDIYDDVPPPRRRVGIMAIAAVFALAVIGTAGAFGYRTLFGSSGTNQPPPVIKADTAPSKIVPAAASKTPNKLITDRVAERGQDEKLVSREEQPVEMKDKQPAVQGQTQQPPQQIVLSNGVMSNEPKKIRTIVIHPDQPGQGDSQPIAAAAPPPPATRAAGPSPVRPAAPPSRVANNVPAAENPEPPPQTEARAAPPERHAASAPRANAPLSLNPDANAAVPAPAPAARTPMRTAAVPPAAAPARTAPPAAASGGGGSYVQVSSQRSEAEAQAAFHSLQSKYPNQLGNRQPVIRKVELGEKGTYFRAMVGPLAGNEATELCTGLKAAGGSCLIQRN